MIERSAELGAYFKAGLEAVRSNRVREVRGRGLMLAVELHADAGPARPVVEALRAAASSPRTPTARPSASRRRWSSSAPRWTGRWSGSARRCAEPKAENRGEAADFRPLRSPGRRIDPICGIIVEVLTDPTNRRKEEACSNVKGRLAS